jgi:hypothetical protein
LFCEHPDLSSSNDKIMMLTKINADKTKKTQKKNSYPKSDIRHWLARIHKPTDQTAPDGKGKYWAAHFQHANTRCCWSLGTPNKQAAAARAKEIYEFLKVNDWPANRGEISSLKARRAREGRAK